MCIQSLLNSHFSGKVTESNNDSMIQVPLKDLILALTNGLYYKSFTIINYAAYLTILELRP
jgi:hypothetical protein